MYSRLPVSPAHRTLAILTLTLLAILVSIGRANADHVTGGGQSYTFLAPGFTQDVFGTSPHFMGGVAFAPDGDSLVDDCSFSGSELHRFDRQSTLPLLNGTVLHPQSAIPSNAGCGLTNHPNGSLYTNTSAGVVRLDPATGAQTGGPFGPGGNALGITVDPQTGNVVYVGSDGTLHFVDAALTTTGVFSVVTTTNFLDGIAFDPPGNYLFISNRSPSFRLTIVNRSGGLVQHVAMTSEPDGIAFHATAPKFVVTNNIDGTITRFDFPGDDHSLAPALSVFASGGFRGDLGNVGPDGCFYVTQDGTRYNDGTVTFAQNSLVRICGGFAPPPGVGGDGPDLVVTKEPKPGQAPPVAGGYYSFIIKVTNAGNQPTPAGKDVMLRDDLSGVGTFSFWWASAGTCSTNTPYVDCRRGRMAPGETWTIEIRARLATGRGCTLLNRAIVDRWDVIKETNENNNTATLPINVCF